MSGASKIQELVKASKLLEQKDVSTGVKKKSLIESGIRDKDAIDFLLKLKKGGLNTITLFLDNEENSDCAINLRLLTAQEELDVQEQMHHIEKTQQVSPLSIIHNIYYISKVLSRASKPLPTGLAQFDKFNQPQLSEEELRIVLDTDTLLALGNKYLDFRSQYAPQLEQITDEDINDFVTELNSCEDNLIKKLGCLNGLRSRQTERAVLLDIHKRYLDLTKQLDKLLTG